jgi:hypothetical protein
MYKTGEINQVSGVYRSQCCGSKRTVGGTRTILKDQKFPRCGYCNSNATWIFVRLSKPGSAVRQPTR